MLPENVPAISVFIGVFSQWDTAGMDGIRTGIKREAIPMAMAARRIPPEQLGDIVAGSKSWSAPRYRTGPAPGRSDAGALTSSPTSR